MATLEKAIALAAQKHEGQQDKAGEPYILHVLRVALAVRSPKARIAAVLHDILEDTDVTVEELQKQGFSEEVIQALLALTKLPGETRLEAAGRAKENPIAREVKLADNADNLNIYRLSELRDKDVLRLREYLLVRDLLVSN